MSEYNSISTQRQIWSQVLGDNHEEKYSYSWGNPESEMAVNAQGDLLGNYKRIADEYILPFVKGRVVLDLGSFDGKWVRYFLNASKIICADITDGGFDIISKEYIGYKNFQFYLGNGIDLFGIEDNCIDFVFCMDCLVRSEIEIIECYINELKRILKPDGMACIHLPNQQQKLSWEMGFTQIDTEQIIGLCYNANFSNCKIDTETINHGVLLLIGYGTT